MRATLVCPLAEGCWRGWHLLARFRGVALRTRAAAHLGPAPVALAAWRRRLRLRLRLHLVVVVVAAAAVSQQRRPRPPPLQAAVLDWRI